jgi:2,4-dienoyl-CoA reductase-like NADH-dependent reductase (Old Yellow Enzyme family)/thioredoxin reductase
MTSYPNLFSAGRIAGLELKNKVVMPAMGTALASQSGEVTDHQIAYYEERARGGVGLVIVETSPVENVLGKSDFIGPRIDAHRFIPMMYRLANAVHKHGAKVFVQLQHAGRQSNSALTGGKQIVAPSPLASGVIGETPRELAKEEIREIEGHFVTAALNCKLAGMDGVEIHGAHGFLVNQFLSPRSNRRTDEYGGTLEKRTLFARRIVKGIKEACGVDFPVIIRLSVDEFVEGGIEVEDGVEIAKLLEAAGVDAIDASSGVYESFPTFIEPITYGEGWRVYLAEAVKQEVEIPVIAVGVIRDPAMAEEILVRGRADLIGIGRGLISDPEWPEKARRGEEAEIRKCISCMYCVENAMKGGHLACAINARAGRELEFETIEKSGGRRKVVVVGGGPAGMEAARVLALRDFEVVLFEKEDRLGGLLNFGNKPRGKEKITWLIEYLSGALQRLEVEVRLGESASREKIEAQDPHAVFVCTGGTPILPEVSGIDEPMVCSVQEALSESGAYQNERIAVIGGGETGCEAAELLASGGNEVHLVEMLPEIAGDAGIISKMDMMARLKAARVHIHTATRLARVTTEGIVVEDVGSGKTWGIEADRVVISLGMRSDSRLFEEIRDELDNVFLVGDAVAPRTIGDAMREGFERAMLLQ